MSDRVVIDLQVCLYVQEPSVLNVCYVLELEVFQSATIRKYFHRVVTMGRVEMALFKAILDCQEFELRRVPSYLGILKACGPDLYYAGLPIFIFLE